MKTKFKGIVWLGVRTKKFDELSDFYKNKMGLPVAKEAPGFLALNLPNGDKIEIFGEEYKSTHVGDDYKKIYTTGPVVGFLVDNIDEAKIEMEAEGIEFIGSISEGRSSKWIHFRGVDDNIYEIIQKK